MQTLQLQQRRGQVQASVLLVVLAIVLWGAFGARTASAAGSLSWSAPALVDHELHPAWGLNGVSCPSASLCVALDEAGNVLTSTNPTGGPSAWSTPLAVDPGNTLDAISCPTVSLCVGVDDDGNAVVSTDPTGGASAWTITKVDPNAQKQVGQANANNAAVVSCPTANLCVIVDLYNDIITSTNPTGGAGSWTLSEESYRVISDWGMVTCASTSLCVTANNPAEQGVWLTSSTNPTGGFAAWKYTGTDPAINAAVVSGSCPSASLCVVGDTSGNVLYSATPVQGPWTTTSLPIKTILKRVNGLSCPSTSFCVAVDVEGEAVTTTNPTGGESAWTPADIDASNLMTGVSCPTASFCAAVDSQGNVLTSTNPTGGASAWSMFRVDESTVDRPNALSGLSCQSSSLCVAADEAGNVLTSTNPAGGAGAWSAPISVDPYNLSGVSCAKAVCVAVDQFGNVLTSTNPTGGPGAWTAASIYPSAIDLTGVSCPKLDITVPQYCVAVDAAGNVVTSGNPTGGAGAWTTVHVDTAGLTAISCPDFGSLCVTVDNNGNVVTSTEPTGGASAWTVTKVDTTGLTAVSCVTSSSCVAVDNAGDVLTSTNPTGGASAWTVSHVIDASAPFDANVLTSVSCPFDYSVSLCVATNLAGSVLTSVNLAGGPGAWASSDADGSNALSAVFCPSAALCVAADKQGNVLVGTGTPEEHEQSGGTTGGSGSPGPGQGSGTPPGSGAGSGGVASVTTAQVKASLAEQLTPPGKAAKIAALLKSGGLSISFTALEAGTVVVQWYFVPHGAKLAKRAKGRSKAKPVLVASGKLTFSGAGTGKLNIRLTAAGKRLLKHAKRLKLTAKGTFTPSGGAAASTTKKFLLK